MTNAYRLAALAIACLSLPALAGPPDVQISELRVDQPGADTDEYFELFGQPEEFLDGLTYIVLGDGAGGSGVIEAIIELDGQTLGLDGLFVAATIGFSLGDADLLLPPSGFPAEPNTLNFENSDNVTHMLVFGFTGAMDDDLDTDDDGVLDVMPWSEVISCIALLETSTCGTCPTDANGDGDTGPFDLATLLGAWGPTGAGNCLDANADLDIGPFDLATLLGAWGACPAGPEEGDQVYCDATVGPDGEFSPGHAYTCTPSGTWSIGEFDIGDPCAVDTPSDPNASCDHACPCGSDGAGGCFEGNGSPNCNDSFCCLLVCDEGGGFEACCTDEWTDDCADQAITECLEPGDPPLVFLNEIRTGQLGADTDEYFELKAVVPDVFLDGVSYIVIGDAGEGTSGIVENVTDLTGEQFFGDLYVGAEITFSLGIANNAFELNFEDSDNVTHMLVFNFLGKDGQDLDLDDDGVLDIEPWGALIDSVAIVGDNTPGEDGHAHIYSDNIVGPDGPFFPGQTVFTPGHVYLCTEDGPWTVGEFDIEDAGAVDTPAAANQACDFVPPCGAENAGPCFQANGTPNCDDEVCCTETIASLPGCAVAWDEACVDLAVTDCLECGHPEAGNCFTVGQTPFCNNLACCDLVCTGTKGDPGIPSCCEAGGWIQGCVDRALAVCEVPDLPQPGDVVFGLSTFDELSSLELVRGAVEEDGGTGLNDPWEESFMQSVQFDNLDGILHNNQGNLLVVNFGGTATGGSGTIHNFATCIPSNADQFIGDTLGEGGPGLTTTLLGGLSVSPDNSKIAVTGNISAKVIVYDYTPGDCQGAGASLSGARETGGTPLCSAGGSGDTQGTIWLDNDTVLAFSTTGDIVSVNANTMVATVVATVDVVGGCGPGFTDIEYNPNVSPNVYAMYSSFTNTTNNTLFVLDPTDGFALLATIDYSESIETTREIAFDGCGNLFVSQYGGSQSGPPIGGRIDIILDAANIGSLADNNSFQWYFTPTEAAFNGMDVGIGNVGCP